MTTIKDRLRASAYRGSLSIGEAWNLLDEAADEIERLERELAKARSDALAKCVAACESERVIYDLEYPPGNETYSQAVDDCIEAITRALKEKP